MRRASLAVIALAACSVALPAASVAVPPVLPVCSTNPDTGGSTRCATVKPPRAWAKAAAYGITAEPLPRPRRDVVLRPLRLASIEVTQPSRIDEGECGTQASIDARYRGPRNATLFYSYVEDDCGRLRTLLPGDQAVGVPGATVAIATRSGGANVVQWTRAPRAAIDGAYMVGTMMLRSSSLSQARLLEIAATIR